MQYNKRVFCLLLTALLLTGCGAAEVSETETTDVAETVADTTVETELTPVLPDATYGGREFRLFHNDRGNNNDDVIAEDLTGEALNDVVYQRNLDTEEKFDVRFSTYLATGDDVGGSAAKTLIAGDDAYDVLICAGASLMTFMGQNLVYDLNEMPYLDMDMPWWNSNYRDNISMNGKTFAAVGDISHIVLESLQFLAFNLDSFDQLGLEPPYALVREGDWTFDKYKEMVEGYTQDVNGDGKIDMNDQYGFLGHDWITPQAFMFTNDVHMCSFEDGLPYIDLELEKLTTVWEAYDDLTSNYGTFLTDSEYGSSGVAMFKENRVLFMDATMRAVRFSLRDMEGMWGVLPLPKFTEDIAEYHAFVGAEANIFMVPVLTTETEMISGVLEYMAYYGYKNITPVYYDEILGQKMMRDQDSRDMLDILRDAMVFDFGTWSSMKSTSGIGNTLLAGQKNPATYLAANRTKMETELQELLVTVGAVAEE